MSAAVRRGAGRALRVAFGVAGAVFLVVAFLHTWDRSPEMLALDWWRLVGAIALSTAGLLCAFGAWLTLVGGKERRALAWGFYVSQLGKYVPGGVWQAAGQIGYAVRAAGSLAGAGTAFIVFSVTQTAAGGILGATLAIVHPNLVLTARLALVTAAGLGLLLHRRWMVWTVRLARRILRREAAQTFVPDQRAILLACLWSVGTLATSGSAYALLLGGLGVPGFRPIAVPALALAWTVGFLALPVPSGIGVREAVLLATLGAVAPVPALIAASVYHRLATMAAEVGMIAATRFLRPPAR